ncbi:MAG: 16S rRNA (cytosine(1402)-N(4))-methyltransferase RsmH [Paracoccaceae bacterium]
MSGAAPHIPVLRDAVVAALAPLDGARVIDATFGAGGYARAFLDAGAAAVIGLDRDPAALAIGRAMAGAEPRLAVVETTFDRLDAVAADRGVTPDAVVFDVGVSSMQLDEAARGFSFQADGPLDMRMGDEGPTAAEIVAEAEADELADLLYAYGEERASRRIARAIVAARAEAPSETTARLAGIVARCLPRPKPGQPHPATRSFQALRIAVNDELGQLVRGLAAAERALPEGGRLAVVSFHSLEDRIVKRFLQLGSGRGPRGARHEPAAPAEAPRWTRPAKAVEPDGAETAANPRARSARLRAAVRTGTPAQMPDPETLGLPRAAAAADIASRARRRGGRG